MFIYSILSCSHNVNCGGCGMREFGTSHFSLREHLCYATHSIKSFSYIGFYVTFPTLIEVVNTVLQIKKLIHKDFSGVSMVSEVINEDMQRPSCLQCRDHQNGLDLGTNI